MVKIDLNYQGELRVQAKHQPSGTRLLTDAPVDNHGKGESFSPTDLVATGLGTCMATVMGIISEREKIDLKGMTIHVEKIMSADAPRRIQTLNVNFDIPASLPPEQRTKLEHAALNCPVAKSLSPEIKVHTRFNWKNR
jgi:putative redox protein